MDLVINNLKNTTENDEEDYESFFLKPASSPYNIAEKVQQANQDLFSNNVTMEEKKTSKVKFKDELLVTYEPDLTDDDVVSIESDEHADLSIIQEYNEQVLEYKNCTENDETDIFDIEDEDDVEEIIEEIETDDIALLEIFKPNKKVQEIINETDKKVSSTSVDSSASTEKSSGRKFKQRKSPKNNSFYMQTNNINCKAHCIEKIDNILSMSIQRLEIHEKPINFPPLKLRERKCCDENKLKNEVNLPCYNGLRSEYGLNSLQIERRERRKEIIRLKNKKRQELLEEYKDRRNQQNEEVFCQWLKDVARRKMQRQKINKINNSAKQCLSPNVVSFPRRNGCDKLRERPKTANVFVPRQNIKKTAVRRPQTTHSCFYLEVPRNILQQGINLEDILVANSNAFSKKIHIFTIS